jgi:polyvinyl alcohol dehydrogenase (cytochrome)
MRCFTIVFGLALVSMLPARAARAQEADGQAVFTQSCASCHVSVGSNSPAPGLEALREEAVASVLEALTTGVMRPQAQRLNPSEIRAVAEWVTGKKLVAETVDPSIGRCPVQSPMSDVDTTPAWNGWGVDLSNTRFQTAAQSGLSAADVPRLKLKWAFGLPETSHAWSQPSVVGGRVFVGSQGGRVYSLDARTGCTYWSFIGSGAMRTTVLIGPTQGRAKSPVAYFSTIPGWVYALDANTGEEIWKTRVEAHESTRTTGSPVLHNGILYVPVGSFEEGMAGGAGYQCCTFRGSLSAIDAATGKVIWKSYTITEPLRVIKTSASGQQVLGPSGGGIWSSPIVDAKRKLVYVATGNGFTGPMVDTTDAILALDMETGKIRWKQQVTKDVWLPGCPRAGAPPRGGGSAAGGGQGAGSRGARGPNDACPAPEAVGTDVDFGSSPILATLPGGKELIVAGQKSGDAWALDPDKNGTIVWKFRAALTDEMPGSFGTVVWGQAVDRQNMYVPLSDIQSPARAGGLQAINLMTGQRTWFAEAVPPICKPGPGCNAAQAAAPTVIAGVVFSGSADGGIRAYSTKDGSIIWTFDTNQTFETVNKVKANGGSLIGPGPVVAGGMLFVTSGYGSHNGRGGNIVLAFGLE